MFRPKIINIEISGKPYELRIEYWWFSKDKIFPRYKPTYIITDLEKPSNGYTEEVHYLAGIKEVFDYLISNTVKNLLAKFDSIRR